MEYESASLNNLQFSSEAIFSLNPTAAFEEVLENK
jgi:hypothetical protein